ncbi:permease prefix domain 1-containing protein [Candidatus Izimaplasma bacterium]|nr:permease prefix domain 1-containing protein [Candidatus Izimaplasma bacterium]
MKRIKNFVKNTFKDVPKENREEIIKRVTEVLMEKVEDLIENGLSEQEAIDRAVIEFGTAEDFFEPEGIIKIVKKRLKSIKHYRNDIIFSVTGAIIIIGMLIFTNLYYAGKVIWFVLPALAVLWWPLAVIYNFLNKKENKKENNDE